MRILYLILILALCATPVSAKKFVKQCTSEKGIITCKRIPLEEIEKQRNSLHGKAKRHAPKQCKKQLMEFKRKMREAKAISKKIENPKKKKAMDKIIKDNEFVLSELKKKCFKLKKLSVKNNI